MSVLLPNDSLTVRRRSDEPARNAHGERVAAGYADPGTYYPGRTSEGADGSWVLGVDTALWPIRTGDLVHSSSGQEWLVTGSDLITNSIDDSVDWVRVQAYERRDDATEPGGAQFVGR